MSAVRIRRSRLGCALVVFLLGGAVGSSEAIAPRLTHQRAHLQASVSPSSLRLGQRATYRGRVVLPQGIGVHFEAPVNDGAFSWGPATLQRGPITDSKSLDFGHDSVVVTVPIQIFETGLVALPGLRFRLDRLAPRNGPVDGRLPVVRALVTATVSPTDSTAQLRPVRGPLLAPWWERIPWARVLAALVVLGVVVNAIVWWLRRARRVVPAKRPAIAAASSRRDPAQHALAALAALRAERLPDQGAFGEHALTLSRILREFLEATLVTPRPGDTSAELLARLTLAHLPAEDVTRLEGLLGFWDRVKFARAPMGVEEAGRCEGAVESLIRRGDRPREAA